MIFDQVGHLKQYAHIPWIEDVVAFLNRGALMELKEPEIEIRGRDLFVRVMRYQPKPAEQNKFETHRQYADIQVMVKGREIMQYARPQDLVPTTEYDSKGDYRFFTVDKNISELVVNAGEFVVFFPGEPHRPSCLYRDGDGENLKLVFKVRMENPWAI
jgi:YhcH/YjgK/YiaL family protein